MSCTHCEKKCLSFLVLRPSPIAVDKGFAWHNAKVERLAAAHAVVPQLNLKKSNLALRLLRRGYLHIYMPEASVGAEKWRTYHVDEAANMRLIGPAFAPPATDDPIKPCTTEGHDAYGQKLVTIPNASRMKAVWLAFSANLWTEKLKAQNAANPRAMVELKLMAGGLNTFKPTAEILKKHVLECAVDALRIGGTQDIPLQEIEPAYPFATLMGFGKGRLYNAQDGRRVQQLADALTKAAASSPTTAGLYAVSCGT